MTVATHNKPLPTIDEKSEPFWESARMGRLTLQRCTACGHLRYPINHLCPKCLDPQFTWEQVSGRGKVYSTIVFHQVYNQAFAADVPYNVSLIQLEEGPRMISNVIDCAPSDVKVGDKVEVIFDHVTQDVAIPRFKRI